MEGFIFLLILSGLTYWVLQPDWKPATRDNLKPGSVVRLKSGGPEMVVVSSYLEGSAYCTWLSQGGRKMHREEFGLTSLEVKK